MFDGRHTNFHDEERLGLPTVVTDRLKQGLKQNFKKMVI